MTFSTLDPARKRLALDRAQERVQEIKATLPRVLSQISLELTRRELQHFKTFVHYFWSVLEPDIPLSWNWHLDELCDVAEKIVAGDSDYIRTVINVPPGTMKSLLISVLLRAWIWSKDPSKRFLSGSYSDHLSLRDNVKLRNLITSQRYQELFSVRLTGDQNAKEKFETSRGGWSIATGVGGAGTGEHPDFAFIDDPLTEQQSRSKVERDTANNWIDRTLSSRGITRNMRTILIMQRFDKDDCTGHVLAKGGWHHVSFPMRYVGVVKFPDGRCTMPDIRDRRREKGELLWPELFPEHKLRALEIALGPYGTAGQLQQTPVPEGGGLFRREWFRFASSSPRIARRVRGWDTAGTEDGGDWTAGVKMAEPPGPVDPDTHEPQGLGQYFIENVVRGQWGPTGVDTVMKQTAKLDGVECSQREEREGGGSGKVVTSARAKLLRGYDYAEVLVSKDKVTRSKPFRAQCEAGNVFLVRTGDPALDSWIEPYISELADFKPGCENDDQVDGSSASFNALLLEPLPEEGFASW